MFQTKPRRRSESWLPVRVAASPLEWLRQAQDAGGAFFAYGGA